MCLAFWLMAACALAADGPNRETLEMLFSMPRPAEPESETAVNDVVPATLQAQGPPTAEPAPPPADPPTQATPPQAAAANNRAAAPADSALVERGRAAFESSCTQCHNAERALGKRKDYSGWLATVRRMANRAGADIPPGEHQAIATYLASVAGTGAGTGAAGDAAAGVTAAAADTSSASFFATISPLWRGGNDVLENPGFFPEAWIGASWQPTGSPVSGRITACISCHTEPGQGSRLEAVEAALRLDVTQWLGCGACERGVRGAVEAGRLIVPFGAFAAQSNPGIYRTVTKPLIYNMGQNVRRFDIGNPVLPMPYSDEGALVNMSMPIGCDWNATIDTYLVNGLRGGSSGIDFFDSRDYVDNNAKPAVGGRATLGTDHLRAGTSIVGGRFNADGSTGVFATDLTYQIWGFDLSAHYEDLIRIQAEYARRDSDRLVLLPGMPVANEQIDGYYVESELRICCQPRIGFLVRIDSQQREALRPPVGSSLASGNFAVDRFTWGFNVTLPGGSLVMINHERWNLPANLENVDVLGIRWAATF
jgi:cytochrome c5